MRHTAGTTRLRPAPAIAAAGLAAVMLLGSACRSGGNGIEDAQATATVAARTRPPATATPDPAALYRDTVNLKLPSLLTSLSKLNEDLLSAQANQADPKWPGVLQSDIAAIASQANSLSSLIPAPDQAEFHAALKRTLTRLQEGCSKLSSAITTANPDSAAAGVALIFEAREALITMQGLPGQ